MPPPLTQSSSTPLQPSLYPSPESESVARPRLSRLATAGVLSVTAKTDEAITAAFARIEAIIADVDARGGGGGGGGGGRGPKPTAEIGQAYTGEIKSIMPFGIFVELLPGLDGFCHISEISDSFVRKIEEVGLSVGDVIDVVVTTKNEKGQYRVKRVQPGAVAQPAAEGAPVAAAVAGGGAQQRPAAAKRAAGGGARGAAAPAGPRRDGDAKVDTNEAVAEAALSAALGGLGEEAAE